MQFIPFNRPFIVGNELTYIAQAHANGHLSGDGPFTKRCSSWLEQQTGAEKALLTHSCTSALEMAAILIDIQPGDEVIIPSYTFVSTANAFVLRGGIPVFVDIRTDTLNIDELKIEQAITSKTKAIVPVHYAGVSCEMDAILDIAKRYRLLVIEDSAQGVMSSYKGRPLGAIGDMGCYSFHETKNVISGEGGALLVNNCEFVERAEIIREKGTNRSKFFRGQVDKYTWVDIGSSYLPGEIMAAFLAAQLESAWEITARRMSLWNDYHQAFADLESSGRVRRPVIPPECQHNAHMYYLLLEDLEDRTAFIESMKQSNIGCVFHYVPLHSAPFGLRHARSCGDMTVTNDSSQRLVRLPLWVGLTNEMQSRIIDQVLKACRSKMCRGNALTT
ncbi:MAG: dTDP-4-amino-4,6-dideoxygalactose transaminase [Planctomycetota bacterium]|jgi:dTDP-4-amino-4,6-dideoxygalactose transaminase